ncbi:MAG: TraB/GumN family protein [Bacteroidia bacterium]
MNYFRQYLKTGIIYVLILCFHQVSAQTKKYPTLLWKVSGNGIKKEGYLYGTMHVSKKIAFHLSDQFFQALTSSDVVGLETNPAEWLENMELIGEIGSSAQLFGSGFSNSNFYQTVFNIRFPERRIYKSFLSYDPDIINSLLFRHVKSRENFEENTYIDLFIYQVASKLNKSIVSLEDFKAAEIYSRLANLPDDEFSEDKKEEDLYGALNSYKSAALLEEAYGEGNLDMIDSLNKNSQSENMQRFLLIARNKLFVHTIDSILKSGNSLFSGVGAAHLPGDEGVIEMLRKLGYTVNPVYPKMSKKANKQIEKYNTLNKSMTYVTNHAADSLFTVNTPGKLTSVVDFDLIKYSICADMTNGHYYTVARMNTNGIINDYNPEKMMLLMDSLFYDNIPGKIISKKKISIDGVPGFDIINKTRSGDFHRYQLFFQPLEIILFKLGAKNDFVNTSEGKQFFNSIHFSNTRQVDKWFEPKNKGFKVKYSGKYSYSRNDYVGTDGLVEDFNAYDEKSERYYGVKHAVYNDFYYLEEDTFELNRLSANVLRNYDYLENYHIETSIENNFPTAYLQGRNSKGNYFFGKVVIKGIHYYLVYSIVKNQIDKNDEFFNSFELTDFHYEHPIKQIVDPDIFFKTKDEVSESPRSRFNEEYVKIYNKIKDSLGAKKVKPVDFDYYVNTKYYYSPSSHEYVEIFYERYNDYDYKSKDEFIKGIEYTLGANLSMYLENKKLIEKDGTLTYSFDMKDTATSRAIKCKVLVRGGAVYQVKTPYDTILGLKGWADSFFNSFELSDSIIGKNIFVSKFDQLLNDLISSDTAVKRRASHTVNNTIVFQKEYANSMVKFIKEGNIEKLNTETKAQIFVNAGIMHDDIIVDTFKELYDKYEDSTFLQLSIIKGLAYCRTKNAYSAIKELLLKNAPVVGSVDVVNDVFKVMHDSLDLCCHMYPEVLKIVNYDEYREPVLKLLNLLVRNNLIKPEKYSSALNDIVKEANIELRRFNAAAMGKSKTNKKLEDLSDEDLDLIEFQLNEMSIAYALSENSRKDMYRSSRQNILVDYVNVLLPFYKKDNNARSLVDKVLSIKQNEIYVPVLINSLNYGIKVPDSTIQKLIDDKYLGMYIYHELIQENQKGVIAKLKYSDTSIVKSYLNMNTAIKSALSYDRSILSDSLSIKEICNIKSKYQSGQLYIFQSQPNKFGLKKWYAAFKANTRKTNGADFQIVAVGEYFNEKFSEDKIIRELKERVTNASRGRISVNQLNSYY